MALKFKAAFALASVATVTATCSSTAPTEAEGFSVVDSGTYKTITTACGTNEKKYVLYPRASSPPDLGAGFQYFGVPLQSALVATTVPIAFIEKLGKRTSIKVISQYTTSACGQKLVSDGLATVFDSATKESQAADVEAVIADPWGLSGYGDAASKLICESSSSEPTVIGQAEWIKFWGHFFDAATDASTSFCGTEGRYTCNSVAASSVTAASSHLGVNSYSYQVPTAVFATLNTWGVYHGEAGTFDEADYHDAYEISTAAYKVALVQGAGATYPDLSAFASYFSSGKYQFRVDDAAAVAQFHLALQHVDVIIDEGGNYGIDLAATKTRFLSENAANPLRAFTNKRVFKLDATMDARGTGGTGSDWFESRFAEPDALLEDMIAAMHPGSAIASTSSNYLRNVDGGAVKSLSASDCTGALTDVRPERSTSCIARDASMSDGTVSLPSTLLPSASTPSSATEATGFSMCEKDGYKVITTPCGGTEQHYVLYPRASSPPDLGAGFQYFGVPLQSALVATTVPIAFIEKLGKRTSIKVISQYTTSACGQKLVSDGLATVFDSATKESQAADVEAVIADPWGLSGYGDAASKLICESSSSEPTVIGQAEWIKFWGHFFDAATDASTSFCGTEGRYTCNSVAASSVTAASSHLGVDSYSYQVPTAVFATLNTWGVYHGEAGTFDEADYHDAYEISTAAYKVALVQDAGATYPDLSAFASYFSSGKYQFRVDDAAAVAQFHLALQHVDVIIDEGGNYGIDLAATKTRFLSENAANPLRAFTNKRVFKLDATMDARGTGGTGSDWFESRFAEPDALLEDMIAAMHPGSAIASTSSNYLRNVDGGAVKSLSASDCTGALTAGRPARSTSCASRSSNPSQLSFLDTFDDATMTTEWKCNKLAQDLPTCAIEGASSTATATFTLSGAVSDYGTEEQAAIQKVIAGAASVSLWRVTIRISPGSVVVVATIQAATSAAATTVQGALSNGIMASASTLQTALITESALATFTVEAAPTLVVADRVVTNDDNTNLILGLAVGLGGGFVLGAVVIAFMMCKKGSTNTKRGKTAASTTASASASV